MPNCGQIVGGSCKVCALENSSVLVCPRVGNTAVDAYELVLGGQIAMEQGYHFGLCTSCF